MLPPAHLLPPQPAPKPLPLPDQREGDLLTDDLAQPSGESRMIELAAVLWFTSGFFAGIASILVPVAYFVWRASRLLDETSGD